MPEERFGPWLRKRKEAWRKEREDRKRYLEELYLAAEEKNKRQQLVALDESPKIDKQKLETFYSSGVTTNTKAADASNLLVDKYQSDFKSMSHWKLKTCEQNSINFKYP